MAYDLCSKCVLHLFLKKFTMPVTDDMSYSWKTASTFLDTLQIYTSTKRPMDPLNDKEGLLTLLQ